jgi:membrane protein YqaA with SNARE-associated domain
MYLALFWMSLLGATIVPFSSEAALTGCLALGYDPFLCLLVASLGNCAGATLNYVAGRNGIVWIVEKVFKFDKEKKKRYWNKFQTHSYLFLLASWLPIVGDPITVFLGVIKIPFPRFALFVYGTRTLRYYAVYLAYKFLS